MKKFASLVVAVLATCGVSLAAEDSTIKAYVDTDVCAHLMIGPIGTQRTECSAKAIQQGDEPVLVRLSNSTVLQVDKQKMVRDLVGKLAEATGELKPKDGRIKLKSVTPIEASSIPPGDPARKLLDVRTYKATGQGSGVHEKIRHELAMMPYISEYDFLSFSFNEGQVILTGWTVRVTNRSEAENRIKNIEGVESIANNIEVLPLGSMDMQVRAGARAALQRFLPRYFWGSGSDIKIVVKNGVIILLGSVTTKADSDVASMQCNSVRGAFKVVNLLRVNPPAAKEKKS
jgi:hyperosmotically inducible protein